MKRWLGLVAAVVAIAVVGVQSASGAGTRTLSFDAATFAQIADTTHSAAPPCENAPDDDAADGEFHGAMLQRSGGMLLSIQLAPGTRVTKLRYVVVDQDQDADSFVYLLRKNLAAGLKKEQGYVVMATTHSTGNVLEMARAFADTTIQKAAADPAHFAYYLEIVNCAITLEPIGVQVTVAT